MKRDRVLCGIETGCEFDEPEDNSGGDECKRRVEDVVQCSPIPWLVVNDLGLSFSLVHDQVELDCDTEEDEDAELLEADAAHVEMDS